MIYTLTLNPAIDLFISMNELIPKKVNRSNYDDYSENGKGVNVSKILHQMGIKNIALGFIAGFTGKFIEDRLKELGIDTNFIEVEGITRVNVFLNAKDEYKIVNKGPNIPKDKVEELLNLIKTFNKGDFLIISGSLPVGIDVSIYKDIIKICKLKDINIILDTSYKGVLDYIDNGIYLIKPNDEELANFFGIDEKLSEDEILYYGKKLIDMGCSRVLISRGEDGAIYIDKNVIVSVSAALGNVINTACAGDTLLASFFGKLYFGETIESSLKFASASASSTAFMEGITDFSDVNELLKSIKILKYIKN